MKEAIKNETIEVLWIHDDELCVSNDDHTIMIRQRKEEAKNPLISREAIWNKKLYKKIIDEREKEIGGKFCVCTGMRLRVDQKYK